MLAQNNEISKFCFIGVQSNFSNHPLIIQYAKYDYFGSKIYNYVRIMYSSMTGIIVIQ